MKYKWLCILSVIASVLVSQCIIFADLDNLGNSSSGGGFIPYGMGIVLGIIMAVIVLVLIVTVAALKLGKKSERKRIVLPILLVIVSAVVTYYGNRFVFTELIDRNDLDRDGLSNAYEELIGTDPRKKDTGTREYALEPIRTSDHEAVTNVSVTVVGSEDYLYVSAREIEIANEYAEMRDSLRIFIGGFGNADSYVLRGFDTITVKFFLHSSADPELYRPVIYEQAKDEYICIGYTDDGIKRIPICIDMTLCGKTAPVEYSFDSSENCYVVEIPQSLYRREGLFGYGDEIHVGLALAEALEENFAVQ
ncbi:MAG: hypothetical protein IKK51_02100 [Oscillospiraceae bacterium]|nr:hypothetical protein [Oscillospiraceae bacterium]